MRAESYQGWGWTLPFECDGLGVGTKSEMVSHFFFVPFSKILISKDLRDGDDTRSRQNLEREGLTGKIFQNKDLAAHFEPQIEDTELGRFLANKFLPERTPAAARSLVKPLCIHRACTFLPFR